MDKKICYIVGAMSLTPALRPYPTAGDYVIAADRGFDSLIAYGVNPDLAVGDFDSLGHRPNHPNVIQLPAEKDDTDMVYAIRKGLELAGQPGRPGLSGRGKDGGHLYPGRKVHYLPALHVRLPVRVLQQRHSGGGHHLRHEVPPGPVYPHRRLPPGREQSVFGEGGLSVGGKGQPAADLGG